MGIVNVTPTVLPDGGASQRSRVAHCDDAAQRAPTSSTSAANRRVPAPARLEEELARVLPVLRGGADARVPVSVDTAAAR
jgi:dihydropteroate synthase